MPEHSDGIKAKPLFERIYFVNPHIVSQTWPWDEQFVADCIRCGCTTFAFGRVLYVFARGART